MPKLLVYFILVTSISISFSVNAGSDEEGDTQLIVSSISPMESHSDQIGGLRSFGPVQLNDVTGKVTVNLPAIGPSPLLSVQPIVRTRLSDDHQYTHGEPDNLVDNFDLLGVGGSIGWGHFWVIDPTQAELYGYNLYPMTYYQFGNGGQVPFFRDYLYQDHTNANVNGYFTFQNTIDSTLRRMIWQAPTSGHHFLGDYILLEPSGRKITFRRRLWNSSNVNDGFQRLYYPIRIEEPNREWVNIVYEFDSQQNQTSRMSYMVDSHDRKLRFFYTHNNGEPYFLSQIRFLSPAEDPLQDMGSLLASFTYMDNGLGSKSLETMTDAEGYLWRLDWGQGNPAFRLEKVVTPTKGEIILHWVKATLNVGHFTTLPSRSVISWRVDQIRLQSTGEDRSYNYSWQTLGSDAFVVDPLLEVKVDGPEGLQQITHYDNMPTEFLEAQNSEVSVAFPTAGYPVYRQTSLNGTSMIETWDQEPVFLWATSFQPPHGGILGSPAGNAVAWAVRPKSYSIMKDGQWYDTTYTYGFNHQTMAQFQGQPNASILTPMLVQQKVRAGNTSFARSYSFENRVQIGRECHENPAVWPYVLSLPTSVIETFSPAPALQELISKTTYTYGLSEYPFPTTSKAWASDSTFVQTNYAYYTSGAHAGKLHFQSTGPNANMQTEYLDYTFGQPSQVKAPLQPLVVHDIDNRGNIKSTTENGIVTTFLHDLIGRPKTVRRPLTLEEHIDYSMPEDPENFRTTSFGSAARKYSNIWMDAWGRTESKEEDVVNGITKAIDISYNGVGDVQFAYSEKGAVREQKLDVFGRLIVDKISQADHTLIDDRSYVYSASADGSARTQETMVRDQKTNIKVTSTDFIGRVIETSFNKGKPGNGGDLYSDDYAGGGHTLIQYSQDPATGLTTTTIKPYGLVGGQTRQEVRDLLGRPVSVTDPEYDGGSITYSYNDLGQLFETVFPDDRKLRYIYDEAGRLKEQRQRTSTNPETFDLVLVHNQIQPTYGYIESQVKKLSGDNTRIALEHRNPDALGRPKTLAIKVDEPLFWQAELARSSERLSNEQEVWNCEWRPLKPESGPEIEYVVELQPLDGKRASLYFPELRNGRPEVPLVTWTLDHEKVVAAINAQMVNHPDRQAWLADAQAGQDAYTVLDPERNYRFRVTAIDTSPQSSLASYWWGDLADLVVDDVDVQLTQSLLALDFRVFNAGSQASSPSSTKVYLSEEPTLPADAQAVFTFQTPAIDPGFAEFHSLIDLDVSGFAYVFILVDTEHDTLELSENNNLAHEFLAYQGQTTLAKPDVVVEEMNYAYVVLGDSYETYATYAVQNQNPQLATSQDGMGSLGNGLTHLYYSSDNIISNDDMLLATPECVPLAPMAREIQTTSLGVFNQAIPLHLTHLVANANSGLDEQPHFDEGTNRFNNVAAIELPQLTELGPDLVVSHFLHQGVTGTPGNLRMNLSFTLRNLGVWRAAPSHVGFYYSSDASLSQEDVRLKLLNGSDSMAVDGILPGWNHPLEGSASLNIPSQQGYLIVVADVEDEIVENDEQNWRSQSFQGYADLVIEGASYNATTKRYSMLVRNIGNLASTASEVRAYLDFSDQYNPTRSYEVLNAFAVAPLEPGQATPTYTTPASWVPPSSNLNTYLFFMVDPLDNLHERDESNNITAPFLIKGTGQAATKPDLVPDRWGFTHDIWPDPQTLVAPDMEISRPIVGGNFNSFSLRGKTKTTAINYSTELIFSTDSNFGSADDYIVRYGPYSFLGDLEIDFSRGDRTPVRDYVRMRVTSDAAESRSTNNTVYTQRYLPNLMAVHSVTNLNSVGCGPSTVAVFMSRDNLTTISSGDDLIGLYLNTGFAFAGSMAGPMIDYNAAFLAQFKPLSGWYMKFVVDALNAVDESDETNNVLVVAADHALYSGPEMPRGLPPLPDPGPGSFSNLAYVDGTVQVTGITTQNYRESNSEGLYDLSFQMTNHSSKSIPLKNLSIFVSSDLTLNTNAKLVCSTMLVGDSLGNKSFPTNIPALGSTTATNYRIRVPSAFRRTQYKLIFVANAKNVNVGDDKRPYLYFDNKDTRIIGILEPENWSLGR